MRVEQVNSFLDQLKHNQTGLSFFVKEYNKEQSMTMGKSQINGIPLGIGAISSMSSANNGIYQSYTRGVSRQANVGYETGFMKYQTEKYDQRNSKTAASRWRSKLSTAAPGSKLES